MASIPNIKRHRLIDQIRKQDPPFCCFQETHLTSNDGNHFMVKGYTKYSKQMELKKQAAISILIYEKRDF